MLNWEVNANSPDKKRSVKMKTKMLRTFRIVSMVEGVSFLLLLFAAMPAKYYLGVPEAVTVMGWTHGLLFMLYIGCAMGVMRRYKLPDSTSALIMVASVTPFVCFYLEKKLREASLQPVPSTA